MMKPKCPKCGGSRLAIRAAYDRTVQTEVHCGTVDGFVVFKGCGWSKRISEPAIIRLAVEPRKPETCKWKNSSRHGFYSISCGLRGIYKGYGAPKFCESCGMPVEVVNG